MAKRPDIPFSEIASHALSSAESLLFLWVGGKRSGHEWQAERTSRGGLGDSLTVNLNTGAWMHGASDKKGGDLISLYGYVNGLTNVDAAFEVADLINFKLPEGCRPADKPAAERKKPVVDHATAKPKPKQENMWEPVIPAPGDAGAAPLAHPVRGFRQEFWTYYMSDGVGIIGHVYRYVTSDGGKVTLPCVYCVHKRTGKGEWRWLSFPQPRPLYGLDRLAAKPDSYVLLVEGEKCADAALALLPKAAIVTWPGGSNAVDKADFTPLIGRKIYAWPDCDSHRAKLTPAQIEQGVDPATQPYLRENDQPGVKAMLRIRAKLLELNPDQEFHILDIPKPGSTVPDGWDIADAVADGIDSARLLKFITKTREFAVADEKAPEKKNKKAKSEKKSNSADAEGEDPDDVPRWKSCLLKKNGGEIVACLANVVDILENDERWQGVIAYDEFGQRVVKQMRPPYWNNAGAAGEWDAQDDARTAMWITRIYRFSPSASMVAEAVEVSARNNTINPPKDWLKSLEWDGINRVDKWMLDFMGVPLTKYSQRVARWFFMGMVKRVFEPGCKFDYCLVLEGTQGRKKSSALAAIGGEWYGDTDLDLHNKDSMSALRGKMLYEFPELGSVAKVEATKQKSFLSRQIDEYRPVYGRREIRAPRQLIFTGTTNEWEWNKDPTGGRRFWPVMVNQEIDVPGLIEVRDQLFAEAVVMVKDGHRYWPTSKEQAEIFDPEQLSRSIHDSYIDALFEHVNQQNTEFTLYFAANEWLKIPPQNQSRDIQTRIGNALRHLGCKRIEKRSDKQSRFWYMPPEIKVDVGFTNHSIRGDDGESIPF